MLLLMVNWMSVIISTLDGEGNVLETKFDKLLPLTNFNDNVYKDVYALEYIWYVCINDIYYSA